MTTPCSHCGTPHEAELLLCPVTGEARALPGLLGQRVDRYQVERLLGAGGFGAVYLARHVHTGAPVALKVLKRQLADDQAMVERFLREARAAAAAGSEHLVRVLDAGLSPEGRAFLAMEYLEGGDLRELARREGPLAQRRVVDLVCQVLEGLGAAHAHEVVHRDLKPANVFVSRGADGRECAKLLDFGVSKMHQEPGTTGLTMTGVAMGTPSYMAPEQFFDARSVDARADLYSVAVMLYELLGGRLPFDANSYAELIVKVRTEAPRPLAEVAPAVPAGLAQVVMRGLSRERDDRYASAGAFARALQEAVGQVPEAARGATPVRLPDAAGSLVLERTAATPSPSKAPSLPPASGWVGAAPVRAAPAVRPGGTSSNRWLWVVLALFALGLSCCLCAGLAQFANQAAGATSAGAP
jgi:serine/threonine-protein kinase